MSNNQKKTEINSAEAKKPIAIIKKVLWGIVYGIFAVVMAVVLWLAVDKFILKSPVPSIFGYATLSVETGSMEGTINIGDLVLIKDTGEYKIGDIVTYIREGDRIPTTHRIIYYTENGYITKGDSNNTKDNDEITKDMIFGEVIKIYPKAGLFSKWVKAEGWIYITVILVMIALGTFIIKSDGDNKNNETNPEETVSPEENKDEINLSEPEKQDEDTNIE